MKVTRRVSYLKCERCGHEWRQRLPGRPLVCPDCKSPYWDKAKKRQGTTADNDMMRMIRALDKAAAGSVPAIEEWKDGKKPDAYMERIARRALKLKIDPADNKALIDFVSGL